MIKNKSFNLIDSILDISEQFKKENGKYPGKIIVYGNMKSFVNDLREETIVKDKNVFPKKFLDMKIKYVLTPYQDYMLEVTGDEK